MSAMVVRLLLQQPFKINTKSLQSFTPLQIFFHDYFSLIKEMVPNTEYVPAVLLTREDYE